MIPRFNTVFTALILALTILISSVGVAQVSHICRLALSGIEKQSCETETGNEHACCSEPKNTDFEEKDKEPCCSNEIKVFRQSVVSLTPSLSKFLPVDVAVISLICSPIFFSGSIPTDLFDPVSRDISINTETSLVILNRAILI